jgi:UDP-N-acetylmuramoylalanine--D-glutamate ligase
MTPDEFLKGKRVLVVGLGLLGGGVETTRWAYCHGAKVTVTDLKSTDELSPSLRSLESVRDKITFVLGEHRQEDFAGADIIIVGPAVPSTNQYIQVAYERGIPLENEASLFFRFCRNPVIGVTGTRGKTTTVTWIHHIIRGTFPSSVLTGNVARDSMLKVLDDLDGTSPVVTELSSFQLEYLPKANKAPRVAVITNIMRDHLNRHGSMEEYVTAKANIFTNQTEQDRLVLKKNDPYTNLLLAKNPRSELHFYDIEELGCSIPSDFENRWGEHNVLNLRAAAHAVRFLGISWNEIGSRIETLPQPRFRQEVVYNDDHITIINDTTATTPDATATALARWAHKGKIILIGGGTDKELEFAEWAKIVQNTLTPGEVVLLEGSATDKMKEALESSFAREVFVGETLQECVHEAVSRARDEKKKTIILFSPSAASFEKFTNEFDRGEQFSKLVNSYLGGSDGKSRARGV